MVRAKYRITSNRWCWCGAAAALIVEQISDGATVDTVCSEEHGRIAIRWFTDPVELTDEQAAEVDEMLHRVGGTDD